MTRLILAGTRVKCLQTQRTGTLTEHAHGFSAWVKWDGEHRAIGVWIKDLIFIEPIAIVGGDRA